MAEPQEVVEHDYCVVVLGSTGTGKSSLIRLFCGPEVDVSAAAGSHTQRCRVFPDLKVPRRCWLDTRGLEDSDLAADEEVFARVLRLIYAQLRQCRVKILWLAESSLRCKPCLQAQARFITQFLDTNDAQGAEALARGDIWQSVLLVVKEGELQPRRSQVKGALTAARRHHAPPLSAECPDLGRVDAIGYTCIEWEEEPGEFDRARSRPAAERRLDGFLTEDEVREEVLPRLDAREPIRMSFSAKRCRKCDARGDPRCMPVLCHTTVEGYHPQANNFVHPGGLRVFHPHTMQARHSGSVEAFHPDGMYSHRQPGGTDKYHVVERCPRCHSLLSETTSDNSWGQISWTCTYCNRAYSIPRGGKYLSCNLCRKRGLGSLICRGPIGRRDLACARRVREFSHTQPHPTESRYRCCNRPRGARGCEKRYSSCKHMVGASGCEVYVCCGNRAGHAGCTARYNCCQQDRATRGCSYACCSRSIGGEPCAQRCSTATCRRPWGTAPGCTMSPDRHPPAECEDL